MDNKNGMFWRISRDFAIVMLLLEIISMIYCYSLNIFVNFTMINIILFVVTAILYICIIIGCEKHIKLGPISGIILSFLHLIFSFYNHSLVNLIFGLFLIFIFSRLYILLLRENKKSNTLENLNETDDKKETIDNQKTENQVDEKLKSNILKCAWGIIAYELIFNIIVPFIVYTFFSQNTGTDIATVLSFFFMIFFLAVILPAFVITFILGFIYTTITTINVKKCKKVTSGFYICNYVFQFIFLVTVVSIAQLNIIDKVLVSIIIAFIGIYISYIASRNIQEYNKQIIQNK